MTTELHTRNLRDDPAGPTDTSEAGTGQSLSSRLLMFATSHLIPRALHVVAELGIADRLGDHALDADELAAATGCMADRLGRLLRFLCAHGVFERNDCGLFRHTELSSLLRSDHPQSMRDLVLVVAGLGRWRAIGEMKHTVLTGQTGMWKAHGLELFDYNTRNPEEGAAFDRAMRAKAQADIGMILDAYDFATAGTVVDVGGGGGHLLGAILQRTAAQGILFELPAVASRLPRGQPSPFEIVAGDFFSDPLPPGDTYLLMQVLHDWEDDDVRRILSAIRRAARSGAKLLVMEIPYPDHARPHAARSLDVLMMVLTGGRERTVLEYRSLISSSGWRFDGVIPTGGPVSILHSTAA